jgi:hypothetical protein
MALPTSYLVTTKNLESFFNSLTTAMAPETFTQKFLESLEFKSTNDRLYIGLLKSLGFLDSAAKPTERYFKYLDQSQSKQVLAEAIRETYSDLFAVNINAHTMTVEDVKNKLRTLTQGKNSDEVLRMMANTFVGLVGYADWKDAKKPPAAEKPGVKANENKPPHDTPAPIEPAKSTGALSQLHYNIQIHLPESRDPAVYDVLFKALKQHLS